MGLTCSKRNPLENPVLRRQGVGELHILQIERLAAVLRPLALIFGGFLNRWLEGGDPEIIVRGLVSVCEICQGGAVSVVEMSGLDCCQYSLPAKTNSWLAAWPEKYTPMKETMNW